MVLNFMQVTHTALKPKTTLNIFTQVIFCQFHLSHFKPWFVSVRACVCVCRALCSELTVQGREHNQV